MDFFRNRLTHSMEVAQIAKSIALRLNAIQERRDDPRQINVDIVETAGLAHDVGTPPFGHKGERVLNELMTRDGGFEGNAQTLRVLTRLEKKTLPASEQEGVLLCGLDLNGHDYRVGLNLTARTLSSVLKYDTAIPARQRKGTGGETKLHKGYYGFDKPVVDAVKYQIMSAKTVPAMIPFKTIECQIMDIADDIAYATYDLEDAMKSGLLSALDLLNADADIVERVARAVNEAAEREHPQAGRVSEDDIQKIVASVFGVIFDPLKQDWLETPVRVYRAARLLASSGYVRTGFTTDLVGTLIRQVNLEILELAPQLSRVRLSLRARQIVETIKNLVYQLVVQSQRVRAWEGQGEAILREVFRLLSRGQGSQYMPDDARLLLARCREDDGTRARTICDFIAGMTDNYVFQFYQRLVPGHSESFLKPI